MIYVIGSGPSGVSAALALINKGLSVTMLDVGFELEPERVEVVRQLRSLHKKNWDYSSINMIKENMTADAWGVDVKYTYGSDFPYRGIDRYQKIAQKGVKMVQSFALGGLSNVWGASILPFREIDIKGWPITLKDLSPHYRSILSLIHHSAKEDGLSDVLPLYNARHSTSSILCRQAYGLLSDLTRHKDFLNSEGFFFGSSRLAVKFEQDHDGPGCPYCGMCLYGCPYGNIYSSASTLGQLLNSENFHYRKNILVEKLVEKHGEIRVLARSLDDSKELEFRGSRAFLAAGLLSSTRILLQSMDAFHHPLTIKHSEHFQIPLIRYDKTRGVVNEDLNTLAQLSIALLDRSISENTVHMQVYAYNDLYIQVINRIIGSMAYLFKRPIEEVLGRLLIIKGYLHSDISSRINVCLEPGKDGRLLLEGRPSDEAKKAVKRIISKLIKNRRYFRLIPISVMASIGEPGKGNHSGGSFPMKKHPTEFETDELGRPYGFKKVHVVDSTVFPSIPATTITLTIMANAHRIASACC